MWQFAPCVCISFLGCVDKIGIAFEAPTISTGFGAYLAQVRVNRLCYVLWLCFEMVRAQIHKFCWLAVTFFISKGVWLGCVYVYWWFILQLVHKRLSNNHAEHTQKVPKCCIGWRGYTVAWMNFCHNKSRNHDTWWMHHSSFFHHAKNHKLQSSILTLPMIKYCHMLTHVNLM